jgi:hypothetical protein
MELTIKITGKGELKNIVNGLRLVADDLDLGNHVNGIKENGKCKWTDDCLVTTISEIK